MNKRTQGEVEAQIAADVIKFYVTLFNRGVSHIRVSVVPGAVLIVTQNAFSGAEKQLFATTTPSGDGRRMFKDMRAQIMAVHSAQLSVIIESATEVGVREMHHDISTASGEEAFVFSLDSQPEFRPKPAKHKGYNSVC